MDHQTAKHILAFPHYIAAILPPADDQDLLPLPIWQILSLPAGLLAQGDQSDQAADVAQK